MLNDKDHDGCLQGLKEISKAVAEKDGYHIPMLCFVDRDGRLTVAGLVGLEMSSKTDEGHQNKDMLEKTMIDLVGQGAQSIAFISEAWTLPLPKENTDQIQSVKAMYQAGGSISENPDSIEVLNIIYSTPKFECMAMAKVTRPPGDQFSDGKKIHLEAWQDMRSDSGCDYVGRFNNIWKKAHEGKLN